MSPSLAARPLPARLEERACSTGAGAPADRPGRRSGRVRRSRPRVHWPHEESLPPPVGLGSKKCTRDRSCELGIRFGKPQTGLGMGLEMMHLRCDGAPRKRGGLNMLSQLLTKTPGPYTFRVHRFDINKSRVPKPQIVIDAQCVIEFSKFVTTTHCGHAVIMCAARSSCINRSATKTIITVEAMVGCGMNCKTLER